MSVTTDIVEVRDAEERSRLCESVLRELPEWFGIEEATAAYIRDVADLPTFAAGDAGFVSLKLHSPRAAELYVMGVRPGDHRRGLGTSLLAAAEAYLRARGVECLRVKTARAVGSRCRLCQDPELLPVARVRTARGDPRPLGAQPVPAARQASLTCR